MHYFRTATARSFCLPLLLSIFAPSPLPAASAGANALPPEGGPNIVFIMADDLGWADVAFHGGNAPTPHLDRLAREGLELGAHSPAATPRGAACLTTRS